MAVGPASLVAVVWLTGCAVAPDTASDADTEAPVEVDTGVRTYIDAEIASALDALIPQLTSLSAAPVLEAYERAMAHGGSSCPIIDVSPGEAMDTEYWWGGCSEHLTETSFNGPMTHWTGTGVDGSNTGEIYADPVLNALWPGPFAGTWDIEGISGQGDVFAWDGSFDFDCACTAIQAVGEVEGDPMYATSLAGIAGWEPASDLADTWLDGTLRVEGTLAFSDEDDGRRAWIDGVFTDLEAGYALELHALWLRDAAGKCHDVEEAATVSFWTREVGVWTDVTLALAEDCMACVGEDCLAITPLYEWEERPW